jgi:hypothetical protein
MINIEGKLPGRNVFHNATDYNRYLKQLLVRRTSLKATQGSEDADVTECRVYVLKMRTY